MRMLAEFGDSGAQAASHDQTYFESYGDVSVHELMLKDRPRTLAYKDFIEKNAEHIKGKVVLDVGAGSGILSLFAAKAGAEKVYAVEASGVADMCSEIVKINGFEKKIIVIKDVMEKVELPEKVDIIISEWMGFYLLHESMLESVIRARDRWLKDDGIVLPSHATLYCAPVNMSEYHKEHFEFWKNVYGFDFTPFLHQSVQRTFTQPAVTILKSEQCLSPAEVYAEFDLKTVIIWDIQDIEKKLKFQIDSDATLHGFATWFDVKFAPNMSTKSKQRPGACGETHINGKETTAGSTNLENVNKASLEATLEVSYTSNEASSETFKTVTLDTGPTSPPTHWKQTVCFIPASVSLSKGETIYCKLSLNQDDANKRHYNMSLEMLDSLESDNDDESDTADLDEEEDEEDISEHPVPCDCGVARCRIIKALTEKYDTEQNELEMEAEFVDVTAEVQAAQTLDDDSSYLDSETLSANDDSYSKE